MLDVTYGDIAVEDAERLAKAAHTPPTEVTRFGSLNHKSGSTEPWVSRLVGDFIVARDARVVLETGSFLGSTSVWLHDALYRRGGGDLHVCDIERERVIATNTALAVLDDSVRVISHHVDILKFLESCHWTFDLAWVDDNHEKKHVQRELELLYPKMNPGGLILLHDVFGSCDLQTVVKQWGGLAIDLPRMGPAGGLGIIQVP